MSDSYELNIGDGNRVKVPLQRGDSGAMYLMIRPEELKAHDAAMEERQALLLAGLMVAREALYNPFEPKNQSRAWYNANAAINSSKAMRKAFIAGLEVKVLRTLAGRFVEIGDSTKFHQEVMRWIDDAERRKVI